MKEYIKFEDLGINEVYLKSIYKKGFEMPSPIQVESIPLILNTDSDIIAQAQTGTGKTASFGLPILQLLKIDKNIKAIILVPTRELAIQVSEELFSLKGQENIRILPVYGGSSIERQIKNLKKGVDIVVATPGRAIDLIERKVLKLDNLQFMVLDEADEMLNMGFVEDIEKILDNTNEEKRMFLFSATMPEKIRAISKKYMKNPLSIKIKSKELTTKLTDQKYYEVANKDKFEVLTRILDFENEFYGIIFCRTKSDVDDVSTRLMERGYDAEGLHGDLSQYQRERIFKKFKSKLISILVATDVAARGLDVNDLTHVINYAIPQDPESYVHRIGRTGRAGKMGVAITFVTRAEYQQLYHIQKVIKTKIKKENIPEIEMVLEQRMNNLVLDIQNTMENEKSDEFKSVCELLIENYEPVEILQAVFKYFLKETMCEDNYNEINTISNTFGKTRLFIAKGKNDGLTSKKLVNRIVSEIDMNPNDIEEVKVLDSFSFITVPKEEAEFIIYTFNKGKKRIVSFARNSREQEKKDSREFKIYKNKDKHSKKTDKNLKKSKNIKRKNK